LPGVAASPRLQIWDDLNKETVMASKHRQFLVGKAVRFLALVVVAYFIFSVSPSAIRKVADAALCHGRLLWKGDTAAACGNLNSMESIRYVSTDNDSARQFSHHAHGRSIDEAFGPLHR
jgi:hypothetical protein